MGEGERDERREEGTNVREERDVGKERERGMLGRGREMDVREERERGILGKGREGERDIRERGMLDRGRERGMLDRGRERGMLGMKGKERGVREERRERDGREGDMDVGEEGGRGMLGRGR